MVDRTLTPGTKPIVSSNSKVYDDGELWSFIRRCMAQGKDIHLDHAERTYEEYSARLDLAALERLPELQAYIVRAVVSARGSSETPPTRHLHCIGYSPTLSGFGVREGSPEGELIATFKRQADADEYIRCNAHETGPVAWEAEYKKLAGVYTREGLEKFIAEYWPGNVLANETYKRLPASDRNTILDAMHYPREYLARWKGKGNSANAQHTLDRLQNMLERTQAHELKAGEQRHGAAQDFVSIDPQGGVWVDMARYLRSPAGQAQFQALGGKKAKVALPTCAHGATAEEVCPECMAVPSDNPDDEIS